MAVTLLHHLQRNLVLSPFNDMPANINIVSNKNSTKNFSHLFAKNLKAFEKSIYETKNEIEQDGIIWFRGIKNHQKLQLI